MCSAWVVLSWLQRQGRNTEKHTPVGNWWRHKRWGDLTNFSIELVRNCPFWVSSECMHATIVCCVFLLPTSMITNIINWDWGKKNGVLFSFVQVGTPVHYFLNLVYKTIQKLKIINACFSKANRRPSIFCPHSRNQILILTNNVKC